jgi:para-aminobenzoate synthetase component 1
MLNASGITIADAGPIGQSGYRSSSSCRNRHDRDVGEEAGPEAEVACARLGGLVARGLEQVSHDPADLDSGGRWAVVVDYEGGLTAARFRHWRPGPPQSVAGPWTGPSLGAWRSSLSQSQYEQAVEHVRELIGCGEVYQANVCRILSAELPDASRRDLGGLHALLCRENPAPYEGFARLPGLQVATASP